MYSGQRHQYDKGCNCHCWSNDGSFQRWIVWLVVPFAFTPGKNENHRGTLWRLQKNSNLWNMGRMVINRKICSQVLKLTHGEYREIDVRHYLDFIVRVAEGTNNIFSTSEILWFAFRFTDIAQKLPFLRQKVEVKSAPNRNWRARRPIRPALICGFCGVNRATRSISPPPGWDTSPSQVTSQHLIKLSPKQFAGSHLYTFGKGL